VFEFLGARTGPGHDDRRQTTTGPGHEAPGYEAVGYEAVGYDEPAGRMTPV
jgi:hypothetical protein